MISPLDSGAALICEISASEAVLSTQLLDHLFVQRPIDVPPTDRTAITVQDRIGR